MLNKYHQSKSWNYLESLVAGKNGVPAKVARISATDKKVA